jgi:YVTN family beta-propeller protein
MVLVATGCSQMKAPATRPLLQEEGALLVYLRAFPADAARLTFRFQEIAAVREGGGTIPLSMSITRVRGSRLTRERRLATGQLPAGRYAGLAISVASATLRGGEGDAGLLTPPEPVVIDAPFTLRRRGAVVLSLDFDVRRSLEANFRFTPVFRATPPPSPAPDLIGVATSRGSDMVMLFDKISGRILGAIPTGSEPTGLAIDRLRRRVYVAASGTDTVQAIDLLDQKVLNRAELRGGDEPMELALTRDAGTLLAVNAGSGTVSMIDPVTMVETKRIRVGNRPVSVLLDGPGRRAYVFNTASGTISVIDVAHGAVAGTIATEAGPYRGQFNRLQDTLFVIHLSTPNITAIDPLSLEVTNRVYVGPGLTAIKVDPQTDRIYLTNERTASLEIYDPLSLLPIDSIPTDGGVSFMAIDDEGNNLYLVLADSGEVQILPIVGMKTTARVEVGHDPYSVVLSGER